MKTLKITIDRQNLHNAIETALERGEGYIYTDVVGRLYMGSQKPDESEIPTVALWNKLNAQSFLDEYEVMSLPAEERSGAIHQMTGDCFRTLHVTTRELIQQELKRLLSLVERVFQGLDPQLTEEAKKHAVEAFMSSIEKDWHDMRATGEVEVCRYTANAARKVYANAKAVTYDAGDIPPFINNEKQRAALALCAEAGAGVYGAALGAVLKNLPRPKEYELFLFTLGDFGRLHTVTSMK